jgi:hypothetical protein
MELGGRRLAPEKLTALEDEFSFTLGEGSRLLERIMPKLASQVSRSCSGEQD